MTDAPPAGWYTDPEDKSQRRWWDGQQWAAQGGDPADAPTEMLAQAPPSEPATVLPQRSSPWQRFRAWPTSAQVTTGVLSVLVLALAAGSDRPSTQSTLVSGTTTASVASTTTSTVGVVPTVTVPVPAVTVPPPVVTPSTTLAPRSIPAAVGMDLQDAQDLMQANGFYALRSHDVRFTRLQAVDSLWRVCNQSPLPGTIAPVDTLIDLGVVKLDEVCP